ncbi:hypothetical protein REPUB_Repub17cG0181100 [Reevesia pubescens]
MFHELTFFEDNMAVLQQIKFHCSVVRPREILNWITVVIEIWTTATGIYAIASVAQFGWALSSYRKGYAGDHRSMPFKPFAIASLFFGASTSASVAFLKASGIHKVEDLMEVGASIRTGLGIRPRAGDK